MKETLAEMERVQISNVQNESIVVRASATQFFTYFILVSLISRKQLYDTYTAFNKITVKIHEKMCGAHSQPFFFLSSSSSSTPPLNCNDNWIESQKSSSSRYIHIYFVFFFNYFLLGIVSEIYLFRFGRAVGIQLALARSQFSAAAPSTIRIDFPLCQKYDAHGPGLKGKKVYMILSTTNHRLDGSPLGFIEDGRNVEHCQLNDSILLFICIIVFLSRSHSPHQRP